MPTFDDWVRVCYHEAGHAVISMDLGYPAVPMVLRCKKDGDHLRAEGTYQLPVELPHGISSDEIMKLIMRLAAGGVAEEIQFGGYLDGVTGDHYKINKIILLSKDQLGVEEHQGHYPATRALLKQNWSAVVRVAEIALRRFHSMNMENVEFSNVQVLSANAVTRVFTDPSLTDQEHAYAQVKAFSYARNRGKGDDPEYRSNMAAEDFMKAAGDVIGELQFRPSRYIDFNSGEVYTAPMDLKSSMPNTMNLDQKIDLFECRVDVWHLGVAAALLKKIEAAENPSIWSHSAYGLVSVIFTYFEMIGKTLNPNSAASGSASADFNYGFCSVYPEFNPSNGIYTDKIPVLSGKSPANSDHNIQTVIEFRNRIRNGIYHLGYTKKGLWIHNDTGKPDFEVEQMADPAGTGMIDVYRMNPHRVTRTIIEHFPKFVADVRDPNKALYPKFQDFFDNYHYA